MPSANPLRYIPRQSEPTPKPVAQLSRPELAGRIQVLREAHELLREQSARDGGEGFRCVGTLKRELLVLQQALFLRDNPSARSYMLEPLEVALARIQASVG